MKIPLIQIISVFMWSLNLSCVVRKPTFCICENKDADQLRGNREADQRLCFRHMDSAIPLLSKSYISSLYPSSVAVQPSLCATWSETPKPGFHTTKLIFMISCIEHGKSIIILGPDFPKFLDTLKFYC